MVYMRILFIFLFYSISLLSQEKKSFQLFCDAGNSEVRPTESICNISNVAENASKADLVIVDNQIHEWMKVNASEILLVLPQKTLKKEDFTLKDSRLDKIRLYLKGINQSGGIVQIEPYYIRERGIIDNLPVISDLISVGKSIFTRISEARHNKYTNKYHAKIVYHPVNGNILFINFIHRDYDSPCNTIFTDCETLLFIDDDSFDTELSASLKRNDNKPLEINFTKVSPVVLPEFEISLDNLSNLRDSARVIKWLVITKETTWQESEKRERFIDPVSILQGIKYSLQLYDAIKAVILYKPAFKARARVYYRKNENNNKIIDKIIFTKD